MWEEVLTTIGFERDGDVAMVLVVEYAWLGIGPDPSDRARMAAIGMALADELRSQCFPEVPRGASCVMGSTGLMSAKDRDCA